MKVLAAVNQDDAGPGLFADAVRDAGAELVEWRPRDGAPPSERFDALIVLGGAMHPDQDGEHPWLSDERRWLASLIERGVPALGVCLGAELLAQAAGWQAGPMRAPEIGWKEVVLTHAADADPLFSKLPRSFRSLQWHSYAALPPAGAPVLACSAAAAQGYRLGERAWGIQFHAEVTREIVAGWIDDARATDADDVREAGVDLDELSAATEREIDAWNALGRELCTRFLQLA